ncbi:methionyl-tRNA synthetase [Colletotrichum scovillei]|uniref:Methionyl-tRNA synthetase n=1 Tax=Colletotrichum scovillei TaxID=1209932 RepID=A0A9P7QTD3_9PEZI|nr:methionyl-tRNA synthetase [Colletotrichum scovillei]KAG7040773.1 methionyl-tRNA synthetase [Colletotrichum scovillei]KAG7060817.1 methionyl-tRNA synthetase [Colletotrichum scovillei]
MKELLPHNGILQAGNSAKTARLGLELTKTLLSKRLNNTGIKGNGQVVGGGEAGLEGLPDLLLGVQDTLGFTFPALKVDTLTCLGIGGGSDELDRSLVVVDLAFLKLGRSGQNHGARLDAAHLDGLQVADNDDLAALHGLEGHETVEARADGAADLALVLSGFIVGLVADGNGGDVEGVGLGVLDGLEDVADTEIDEGRGERGGSGSSLLGLGSLGLLLLLGLALAGTDGGLDLVLGLGDNLLDLLASALILLGLLGAVGQGLVTSSSSTTGGGGSSGLLLLETLLLGLGVDGGLHVEDLVEVNLDLVVGLDIGGEGGEVLDEVEVADDVGVALLAGALLGGPGGDEGTDSGVESGVGLAGLGAEKGGAGAQVGVEGIEDRGGLVGLRLLETSGSGEPLLDLGLLVGSVGGVGGHSCESERGDAA